MSTSRSCLKVWYMVHLYMKYNATVKMRLYHLLAWKDSQKRLWGINSRLQDYTCNMTHVPVSVSRAKMWRLSSWWWWLSLEGKLRGTFSFYGVNLSNIWIIMCYCIWRHKNQFKKLRQIGWKVSSNKWLRDCWGEWPHLGLLFPLTLDKSYHLSGPQSPYL